ncbi:non-ribosomal peptide synthetase [Brasilonema octagenarum UFV-E1]|uniref:Non-ribosomal peptide synthetase n=1 Tax=Brasilonema sennae CENA114 TaxID=415709 RepID=A0A856MJD6_9CYAN|nr:non-ribosomal peptide synthetase [Brasilonema sennae]QDL10798.1 non-ribosomal peptide synthetase [Brasilonema sennae CENA114]QDL17144.1 non-ribosomal peptide synthetase [Brasilonema octagenarum UFV-E1]
MQNHTTESFRLSPQQKRLWSLQQCSLAYCAECALLLEGNLKPEVLKTALQEVINQHGILRTTFRRLNGMKNAVMVVANNSILSWRDINLSDSEPKELSNKIETLFQEARSQHFDLEQEPLLYVSLLKLSENKYILLINLPSLCADTWTLKNLVAEISYSYSACLQSEAVSQEVVQYLQFSEWQNQLLEDEDAEAANKYWQEQNLPSQATLRLPFESQPSKQSQFQPECLRVAIAPELTAKIETLAQKYNTSTAVVLLACWQTLIWRLTGQPDIVIGMACDRRDYEELQNLLGLVATWLPIKSHLTPDLRFKELLELAEQTIEAGSEWQDYFVPEPLENNNTLAFPIGFEFEQLPEQLIAGGVSFYIDKYYTCIEPFKVKLTCTQRDNLLIAEFYYDVNYFSSETIERLAGQFKTLLSSATANPENKISQLEILSKSDRQQLLVEFNQTQIDYPQDKCIHQRFEEQAQKTPNNIAVIFEDQQLTYAELNRKANKIAHHLQTLGVKPEVLVGLCVERSSEMIIGLLGILKAGGAYLPLDPGLPKESLAFRLQDAQVPLLLTQQRLVDALPTDASQIVCLDTDWDIIAQHSDENPTSVVTTENLVYVLFTSGSTGTPKGVAIEHRQLLNYLNGIIDKLNLSTITNFATVSTLAADLGNTVIFSSLCSGGCLHVLSAECATDSAALGKYCRKHPIDCLKIVPSHLATLLASAPSESILPRARLILGGEAASWELIEQIQASAPNCLIFNHYGPTEATVGVTTFAVGDKQANHSSQTVPLGRPLANTQIYLLDQQLQPVPIGVPGELYIGGACLARGYLNRSELTAQRFIPNPFAQTGLIASNSGSRLYKTGDKARYLSDGNIEFLGRVDHQVKVRGFRIELGEIESILCQHPEVQQAAVTAWEKELSNQYLVGYIVPKHKQTLSVSELYRFLRQKLPEYMVPSTFVMLKALPLTPNGKVNRNALPEPDDHRPELEATYEPPRTQVEQTIANIWQQMLHVEKVGIHDNFFDLGGHSLLLVQIHAKLREVLNTNISIVNLFEYPTINSLAKYLTQEQTETSSFEESDKRAQSRIASRQSRAQSR